MRFDITISSSEDLGEFAQMRRLSRAFVACSHEEWLKMKTQTKTYISNPGWYASSSSSSSSSVNDFSGAFSHIVNYANVREGR